MDNPTDHQLIEKLRIKCLVVLDLLEDESKDSMGLGRQRIAAAHIRHALKDMEEKKE